ncbi:PelD GGDEF domain-containing protein [Caballeronia sp. LZ062]|uniref:PelD GGDEF domain-containing protein n=1 Tax=unclassified Caballeronia TaxID=2646786 RepID=UPI0028622079|nr:MULTISPECIES: PelD GGDEF domain-containing protein [unclassified Caballeronia]MDR5856550.1 PelD GGDEF domain-containing protein [Caballeronia sp. LZ050]MDR5873220.1 PelD GGDEF domain-containing protein [Caballeronia sp. LZ062]
MGTVDGKSQASAKAGGAARPRRQREAQSGQSVARDMPWARVFAPSGISGRRAAFIAMEAAVATLVMTGIAWLVDPADPLLLRTGFGWVWLVPVVFALRYGTLAGMASALLLLLAWYAPNTHAAHTSFPGSFFFGGFVLTLLCGQFGDIWIGRQRQARIANDYLAERLSILTKNQFLLRLSHERLEQDVLARPATLRDSLARLRTLALNDEDDGPLIGAARFLKTAAQACQLETASLFAWSGNTVQTTPVASVGEPFTLDTADPLVTEARETLALTHPESSAVSDAATGAEAKTRYRAVAPLLDAGGRHVALLVVERMPFLAMTRDNLQFLLVLAGYYADSVRHADISRSVLQAFPRCPYDFALDYARLVRLLRDTGVESSLVALVFDASELGVSLHEHVLRLRRSLDAQWPIVTPTERVVLTLMPLSGESAVAGYLLRIEENLRAQFGADFESAGVATHSMRLSADSPIERLHQFLRLCHADE